MVGDNREANPTSFPRDVLSAQQRRKKKIGARVIRFLKSGKLPTPDDIREDINFRVGVGEEREEILRHHPYWRERQLRLGLESLIRTAHQAYVDICHHDTILGFLAWNENFESLVDDVVGYAVQKDVIAYCSSVMGTRETLHDIKKGRADIAKSIEDIEDQFWANDVAVFVKQLRNNLLHGAVSVPEWNISYNFQNQLGSGSMKYTVRKLQKNGRWKEEGSKRYLSSAANGTIFLSTMVREHFKLLENLGRELQDLFAQNVSPSERDFFEIEDARKQFLRGQ